MNSKDILSFLKENKDKFSKRQKMICSYIIENYDKAAYMTAHTLSQEVGVSESTVVRFAAEIGFSGYHQMQKRLRQITMAHSSSVKRMEIASRQLNVENILKSVLSSDIKMIENTLNEIDTVQFNLAVEKILNAKNIYIVGVRSAASLATFADHYLHLMFDNVKFINSSDATDMFEQVLRIDKCDVIIGMSFPRYSKNIIKILEYANKKGATVVGITDSINSPVSSLSTHCLYAGSNMDSFVDSLVAPFSVVNALIVALGIKNKDCVRKTFEDLESIWDEYEVYDKE